MHEEDFRHITNNSTQEERNRFFKELQEDSVEWTRWQHLKNLNFLMSLGKAKTSDSFKQERLNDFWQKTDAAKSTRIKSIIPMVMRYAAIVVIAVMSGVFMNKYFLTQESSHNNLVSALSFEADHGSIATVKLNDGSVIWLNSDSKLSIGENEDGTTVAKLDGEALFELVPNEDRKFEVDVKDLRIRDIGTSFNVRAYAKDRIIQTALIDGVVDILQQNGTRLVSLNPGEIANFNKKARTLDVAKIDLEMVTGWKDGKFVFIGKTLDEITVELENWYNVDIEFENSKMKKEVYSCNIRRTSTVKSVMEMLKYSTGIEYEIMEDTTGKEKIMIK
ncbi:FecR family protein [Puteibacter caeruleilacunae]|nr:FecR family protein [Puteibacter caeruleilacunae]